MRKLRGARLVLVVLSCLVAGGLAASAFENESPGHRDDAHHCVTCCTTAHTAAPVSVVTFRLAVEPASSCAHVTDALFSQPVIRLSVPPPKLVA